jgi:hypothetical protein
LTIDSICMGVQELAKLCVCLSPINDHSGPAFHLRNLGDILEFYHRLSAIFNALCFAPTFLSLAFAFSFHPGLSLLRVVLSGIWGVEDHRQGTVRRRDLSILIFLVGVRRYPLLLFGSHLRLLFSHFALCVIP